MKNYSSPISGLPKFILICAFVFICIAFILHGVMLLTAPKPIKRIVTYDMTWEYGASSEKWPNSKHVVLRFVQFPNHTLHIYSQDLDTYLQTLSAKRVSVTFEVTNVGKSTSFKELRIGELERWHSVWEFHSVQGEGGRSPW